MKRHNICNEYIVNPCISVSTILDSTNIDVQDQIMSTHEFHSLFLKMNHEQCLIFDDVMYQKNNPNEPIYLVITRGAGIGKTFTLMLLIQALICFYNIHPRLSPLKKKVLLMTYTRKEQHLTLMQLQFIQVFLYHLIVKIYHH
jgi:hypothetical protein